MKYCDSTLKHYLEYLAARKPAPGGGSAAALAAGLGAALISKVINFTIGKPAYLLYEPDLRMMLKISEEARAVFLKFVDEDAAAFSRKDMEASLNVPLSVARLCYDMICLCPDLVKKSNKNLVSDVAVSAILLESAFFSALSNVEINLKFFPHKKTGLSVRKEMKKKAAVVLAMRAKTEKKVGKFIRG
ncbi:MAG: cyclodeaminase/cyclohydrolase family protein [Candidatus Omnitrophica bacterium]|nr:cyclodeaminase/cyclohydrolase family protein [Candidatus Omnitrophota bacterium]